MDTNYFQAILQLRNPTMEVEQFIESEAELKKNKGVFITKKKKVKNGFDYYLSSNKFGIGIGRHLERKFGGILKINEKLFSKDRQTSKDLYRVNILFRLLPVKKGDLVEIGGNPLRISSIGKKIYANNIATGKNEIIDFEDQKFEHIKTADTIVSKVSPVIEVIDPISFQSVELKSAPRGLKLGEKVKVASFSGTVYFIK